MTDDKKGDFEAATSTITTVGASRTAATARLGGQGTGMLAITAIAECR